MAVVGWCKSGGVMLLLLMQACAMQPAGVGQTDVSTRQSTTSADALALFPAVHQVGPHTDRLAAAKTATLTKTAVWQHHQFPGKQPTQYSYARIDEKHSVMANASSSASMLRQPLRVEPAELQDIVFSWKVKQLVPGADLARREAHDSPVRLVLAFDGDRSGFSMKNAMLSELALTLTGEPLPYATLMYVWCNECAKETLYISPRTDRIREIVLETGPERLGQWLNYQRDIRADYVTAFGQAPGALVGVGIMTDTDNTRQSAVAWYGPISLTTPSTK